MLTGQFFKFISEQLKNSYNNITLSLLGAFQIENASFAIEVVLHLRNFGFKVSESSIRKAFSTASFPGRFEILNFSLNALPFTLILDGAHNPAKMKAFISSLEKLYPKNPPSPRLRWTRKIFMVGFKSDKNINQMLGYILPVADTIITTEFHTKTYYKGANSAVSADRIMKYESRIKNIPIYTISDPKKALQKAFTLVRKEKNSMVVVTGSLYLVGEIKNIMLTQLG